MRWLIPPLLCAAALAHADPEPATFALVLGSNAGGPGQTTLRYAEDDARRVAQVLTDLGGYVPQNVEIVPHPTPQLVRDKLAGLATRVQAEVTAGRQARVFFYYSGHARATALDLGTDQLPLAELRQRLFAIPATLTVVVLDACQSGAIARVKGATPAADFSYSSKQHLDASGVAVLASSSGSELSQESEALRGSYFTHHFLVGLRGAGDANRDGAVSLDEAYRYAYHQTLLATAETAVGGQHVTFEVDLKGHGEVALSFPRKATTAIELPAALEGQATVEDRKAHAVVAETYKAKGAALRIAVAPGDYAVVVRRGDRLARCELSAAEGAAIALDLTRCSSETVVVATRKGGDDEPAFAPTLRLEASLAIGGEREDDYTRTLRNFGYADGGATGGFALTALRQVHPYLWVGATGRYAASGEWQRDAETRPLTYRWATNELVAVAHAELPIDSWGALYARAGVGLGLARTEHVDAMDVRERDTYLGAVGLVGAGVHLGRAGRGLGGTLGYEGEYAPIIDNNFDQTHASGGHRLSLGLTYGF